MKFIFLTNIPTPYRTSFYNELNKYNLDFEVYYMRRTEADRSWSTNPNALQHPYYIDKGLYKMFGRYHFHLNPKLIAKILNNPKAELIIGGGWNDPDVLFLVLLRRLGLIKHRMHFWTEANYLTLGASNDNLIKRFVRKFVYNSTKGAQLSSGKMTELTLEKWGVKTHEFIPLPNTIEEEKFLLTPEDLDQRYCNPIPIFLMPVRLHEQVKGIVNFFNGIGLDNIRRASFLIAGEGPDQVFIEDFIRNNNLEENITLLGHCTTESLVALYKQANVFVLASFTDASPLTVIEALRMKLPLLISERCGNHFEAINEGSNGYLFDPYRQQTIRKAFEEIYGDRLKWKEMGELSGKIYDETFDKSMVIKNFVKKLTDFTSRY